MASGRDVVHAIENDTEGNAFSHPLRGLERDEGGLVPIADTQDAPDGKRYGIEASFSVDEAGNESKFLGVVKYPVRSLDAAERAKRAAAKLVSAESSTVEPVAPSKLNARLEALLRDSPDEHLIDVLLRITEPQDLSLWDQLEFAIARGEIVDAASYDLRRSELIAVRRESVRASQRPIVNAIEHAGGKVTSLCVNMYCMNAALPARSIAAIAERDDIGNLSASSELVREAVGGAEVRAGSQLNQFIASGYDGENGAAADISVAILDECGPNDEHKGFRDSTNPTSFRYTARHVCTQAGCSDTTNFTDTGECAAHATRVGGLLLGDLTDGQDANVAAGSQRIARSGYAGEAWARFYSTSNSSGTRKALDHIVGLTSSVPALVNMSYGFDADDPLCGGQTAVSRDANDLFEDGVLLFKSAGNVVPGQPSDCQVTSPGSAIGVFTVGAHGTTNGDESNVRNDAIWGNSARGGTSTEGNGRTIIDLTAFAARTLMFDTTGGYSATATGTSYASPTVAAAAVSFIDFYHAAFGTGIDNNPGRLHVNMLLMGDRQGESSKHTILFSNLYGAGRLKARRFDAAGMDVPATWSTGQVCVGQDEMVPVAVNNGSPVPAGVDTFEAVAWWYDRRHEVGTTMDDIDLAVAYTNLGLEFGSSPFATDEKERVFRSDAAGDTLEVRIYGASVTADGEGCGTNKMKVYWAYFYEDSARNDADGPGTEIEAE